jgi:hypothetical protein
MSAREKLLRSVYSKLSQNQMEELVDAYAHELAEKIRADIIPELDEYGTREQQADIDGRRGAADLIDPKKEKG